MEEEKPWEVVSSLSEADGGLVHGSFGLVACPEPRGPPVPPEMLVAMRKPTLERRE